MLCSVKGNPAHRRGSRRRGPPADPVAALRDYAIKLHDKGDGRGVDWSKVAEAALRVAFSCLRELPPGDKGLQSVARCAHDAAYSLMAGSPDSETPCTGSPDDLFKTAR